MSNELFKTPDYYDWNVFAERLRQLMDSYGYNMSELADKTDLNVTSISRYLQGRRPDVIAIRRIADHFGVTMDWLLGRIPSKFDNLSAEQRKIVDLYSAASPSDKNVIKILLSKYE